MPRVFGYDLFKFLRRRIQWDMLWSVAQLQRANSSGLLNVGFVVLTLKMGAPGPFRCKFTLRKHTRFEETDAGPLS